MRRLSQAIGSIVLAGVLSAPWAAAQDPSAQKRVAALSGFAARIDALEQVVDDITLSGALALLAGQFPSWKFDRPLGFDTKTSGATDAVGAIAAEYDYGLPKTRGALFRNTAVSDEQRETALGIFGRVKEFVQLAYELERLLNAGDLAAAAEFYKGELLPRSDLLNTDIRKISAEIEQAIKFSAL